MNGNVEELAEARLSLLFLVAASSSEDAATKRQITDYSELAKLRHEKHVTDFGQQSADLEVFRSVTGCLLEHLETLAATNQLIRSHKQD